MVKTKYAVLVILGLVVLSLGLSCGSSSDTLEKEFETRLLVRAPDQPLQVNKPVKVISRSDDPNNEISRIELVLVSTPAGDKDLVIGVTPAPDGQTVLTAEQVFIPLMPGDYVVKAVGYNKNKQDGPTESEYISFTTQ